ncbi:MAG: hypothetical protein HY094_06225 [Candidatus Melainabacteria bacterium]|nr:hypothetical protein [Candidatus Melainabacteria bacterium]
MKEINKNNKAFWIFIIAFLILVLIPFCLSDKFPITIFRFKSKPISYLTYNDLINLSSKTALKGRLLSRFQKQLETPYIENRWQTNHFSKPYIRVAHWNIERGSNINAIKSVFSNRFGYYYSYKKNIQNDQEEQLKKELNDFTKSDIISLNEVDIGMLRTRYKNIASEIAGILGYNYAFATEFVELGPILYKQRIAPSRYLGLHGNAILSKYPIKSARIIRLPECYKWFESEVGKQNPIEYARRVGAEAIFKQQILTEPRRGSRCALVADIELPDKEVITVVSTHLEDRCYPSCRFKQTQHLFESLKYIRRPLLLAGDFNTSTTDSAPTSLKKEIVKRVRDPNFIARQLAFAAIPGVPVASSLLAVGLSKAFQYKDPAVLSIPVLFPNQERKLFAYIKDFRFADGEGFDIRGDSERSSNGKKGLLANSNERQLKGFESTFKFTEPRVIAYFKLDWFFVKPKRKRFEPFNGQTLQLINHSYPGRISDHEPIIVDLLL